MKICSRCYQTKPIEQFIKQGSNWCKDCHTEYRRKYQERKRHDRRYDPRHLLYRSCERAVARGRTTSGRYKNVHCAWKSAARMRDDLINDKTFWNKWVSLCKEYELSGGQRNLRPTIDRIDEKGNYELGNIDALSKRNNTLKATQKAVFVFDLKHWSFRKYPSQKIAKEALGNGYKALDKGIAFSPDGVPHMVQSESMTVSKSKLVINRYPNMTKEEIIAEIQSKLDKARKII